MYDLVLRFRMSVEREPRAAPWVLVSRDGRLEKRKVRNDGTPGDLLGGGKVGSILVERTLALANRVLVAKRPKLTAAHDPTDALEFELVEHGVTRSAAYSWGRASRHDAVLEPVVGAQALADFNELHAALTELQWRSDTVPAPIATAVAALVDSPRNSIEDLVRRLVASPPTRLSELERIIGPMHFCDSPHDGLGSIYRPRIESAAGGRFSDLVTTVSVKYAFDFHHERPYAHGDGRRERDPALLHVSLTFPVGRWPWSPRHVVRELLDGIAGPAVTIDESPLGPGRRYGGFFCFGPGENLSWYAVLPDWAHPKPSDEARSRWLASLAAELRAGCGHEQLVAFFDSLPEGLGVRRAGALNGDDYQFSLEPGMDAREFCRALGLPEALAFSGDVHAQTWQVYATGGPDDVHRHVLPRLGPWEVGAILDGWPKPLGDGAVREEEHSGLAPVYDLQRCAPSRVGPVRIAPRKGRSRP